MKIMRINRKVVNSLVKFIFLIFFNKDYTNTKYHMS